MRRQATPHPDLQPATWLWRQYATDHAPHAFRARTRAEAFRWQKRTRKALAYQLGLDMISSAPAPARLLARVDKGDYVREKYLLRTTPHTLMPFYLLLPKAPRRPLPVVLAFHGHGYGVKDIVGLWDDGSERDTPDGYHKDFGVALCRTGFAVAAPEIACFGERQTDYSYLDTVMGQTAPSTCAHSAALAAHLGLSVLGMRVHDGMRLVDHLASRREIDIRRLGAMGISGGGMHTLFSTCIDTRIKACVISGYFSTFKDSILAVSHCPCNFVHGLAAFGEMKDLAGLVAPRPMLVESGMQDPIFPIRAVRSGISGARRVYAVFGADAAVHADLFEGRHQICGAKAYPFLRACLTK